MMMFEFEIEEFYIEHERSFGGYDSRVTRIAVPVVISTN